MPWQPWTPLLALLLTGGGGLELERLEVPRLARLHRPVKLGCVFRLGRARLHSLRWYKDGEEFFRFSPADRPGYRVFPVPGVRLQMEDSDLGAVSLGNVSRLTAGLYTCEVTSERPDFAVAKAQARLDIFSPPDRYPEIKIEATSLYPGERINATCSSGMSYPKQTLHWFINGIKVGGSCVTWEGTTGTGSGLMRSHSNLSLATSGDPGTLLLTCQASLDPLLPTTADHVHLSLLQRHTSQGSFVGYYKTYSFNQFWHLIAIFFTCLGLYFPIFF